jgi:hypothetical protein
MAYRGYPQLREAAWLYPPGRDPHPLALARLYEVIEHPGGWTVELHKCDPPQAKGSRKFAEEAEARAALARLYALGECRGSWRVQVFEELFGRRASGRGVTES